MKLRQQIFFLLLTSLCVSSPYIEAESTLSPVSPSRNQQVVSVVAPSGFNYSQESNPQIIGIVSPKTGGFPEMNLVRTRIYPSNAKPEDWGDITVTDYKRLGFQDTTIKRNLTLEIDTTDKDKKYSMPAVVIHYSRNNENIYSLVGWIKLKDFDVVVTTKHSSDNHAQIDSEWHTFIDKIRVNADALNVPLDNKSPNTFLLGVGILSLSLIFLLYRKFKTI